MPTSGDWFRMLIAIQGVGPKVALAILGVHSPDELAVAIASGDRTSLTRAAGVGARLASRIAGELKDKVGALTAGVMGTAPSAGADGAVALPQPMPFRRWSISASDPSRRRAP